MPGGLLVLGGPAGAWESLPGPWPFWGGGPRAHVVKGEQGESGFPAISRGSSTRWCSRAVCWSETRWGTHGQMGAPGSVFVLADVPVTAPLPAGPPPPPKHLVL